MAQIILSVIGFIFFAVIIGFLGCTIYFCLTSKDFKKVRFLRLVLYLSLSDCAFGVEDLTICLLQIFNNDSAEHKFVCMMISNLASGIILSSLLHSLLICLERLNATFTTKPRILSMMTSNVSVVLCFVVPHCYTMIKFGIIASYGESCRCNSDCLVRLSSLIFHHIPVFYLVLITAIFYGAVIVRMIKQQRTVDIQSCHLTETQIAQAQKAASRLRRNVTTLGIVISVTVISAFPRTIVSVYAYSVEGYDTVEPYLRVATMVSLLAPLLDPFIYIFRANTMRSSKVNFVADQTRWVAQVGSETGT